MIFWHSSASSQGSDQHAHMYSLARTYAEHWLTQNMYVDEESVQILGLRLIRQHGHLKEARSRGYNTFFMLNSAEHEIDPAYKC